MIRKFLLLLVISFLLLPTFATAEGRRGEEDFTRGIALWDKGEYEQAFPFFLRAAEQGHTRAQTVLGAAYFGGVGVEEDARKGVHWLRKPAEQGIAVAQQLLGVAYWNGKGVKQNSQEAVQWYRKAAKQGHVYSQYQLGMAYWKGKGVKQNSQEAVKWYRKAAEQGNAKACYFLARAYTEGKGVVENEKTAYIWFSIASAFGHIGANIMKKIFEIMLLTPATLAEAQDEAQRKHEEILKRKSARQ